MIAGEHNYSSAVPYAIYPTSNINRFRIALTVGELMDKETIDVSLLGPLVLEYLRSHIAEANAPDFYHTILTQRILYHLAESYGLALTPITEYTIYIGGKKKVFNLAFFKENETIVLLEDENVYKPDFLKEELPKLLSTKAALRVGVTYCSIPEDRKSIVSETADSIKQSKSEGNFLLVLGYVPNTKTENDYIRFDGYFFDSQGKELWRDIDNYDRKVNLR